MSNGAKHSRRSRKLLGGELDEVTIQQKKNDLNLAILNVQQKCITAMKANVDQRMDDFRRSLSQELDESAKRLAQERAELLRLFTLLIQKSPEYEENFKAKKVQPYLDSLQCTSKASVTTQKAGTRKRKNT